MSAEVKPETNQQYHADLSCISRSQLWDAWKRPRVFEAKYITRTMPLGSASSAMDKGTAVHAAVLEDTDLIVSYPDEVLSKDGKASTTAAKQWKAEQDALGKIVLNSSDAADCRAMIDSVRSYIRGWTHPGDIREKSIRWTDEATGLNLKIRPDWIAPRKDFVAVMDLKTTAEVTQKSFTYSCKDYGYWLQAAMYCDGVAQHLGRDDVRFWFLVVESSAPFVTAAFEFDATTMAKAHLAKAELFAEVARRMRDNDWAEKTERNINSIELHSSVFER